MRPAGMSQSDVSENRQFAIGMVKVLHAQMHGFARLQTLEVALIHDHGHVAVHQTFGREPVELILHTVPVQLSGDPHRTVDDRRFGLLVRAVGIDVFVDQLDHLIGGFLACGLVYQRRVEVGRALRECIEESLRLALVVLPPSPWT